jgi:hypothetical protein
MIRVLASLAVATLLPMAAAAQTLTTLTRFESRGLIGPTQAAAYLGGVRYVATVESAGRAGHGALVSEPLAGDTPTTRYAFAGGADGSLPTGLAAADAKIFGVTFVGGTVRGTAGAIGAQAGSQQRHPQRVARPQHSDVGFVTIDSGNPDGERHA